MPKMRLVPFRNKAHEEAFYAETRRRQLEEHQDEAAMLTRYAGATFKNGDKFDSCFVEDGKIWYRAMPPDGLIYETEEVPRLLLGTFIKFVGTDWTVEEVKAILAKEKQNAESN